ncbi:14090_t:CDS:2, partial [Cetraspora pellucida]
MSLNFDKEQQINDNNENNLNQSCRESDINKVFSNLLNPFNTIGGRRFLNESKQALPSDTKEFERRVSAHLIFHYLWRSNFSAPVEEILMNDKAKVLYIGRCGYWTLEMASDFPKSIIVGISDPSCNLPSTYKQPSNVGFIEFNLLSGIPFPDETFDYVHLSTMWASLTKQQYLSVIHETVRVTKHGGWIEIEEPDLEYINLGHSMKLVQDAVHAKLKEDGFDPKIISTIPECFESINEVGNVGHSQVNSPIGNWSGSFGELLLEQVKQFYSALTYMPNYMNISQKEYQQLFADFDKECIQNKTYGKLYRYFIYQKMETAG